MRDKREVNELTIQEAGASAATFSRVARGHLTDLENLLLLAQWVGVAHFQLPVNEAAPDESERPKPVIHGPNETTLESVALHLRADKHLKPEDVDLLMKVLLEQYTFLRKRNQEAVPG